MCKVIKQCKVLCRIKLSHLFRFKIETNIKKGRYLMRQKNIQIFDKIIFLKYSNLIQYI